MATYKHIRSSTANKRPTTAIADGQIALNTNTASPGLFLKDSAGTGIVKIGPVHVGTTAPNATPAAGGSSGNSAGEGWLDTSLSPARLKVWNGSAWVSTVSGVVTTADTGTVTSTMIANGTIVDADINASAAITGTKIQQGTTSFRGALQLTDSTSSTSTTTAATPNSVKASYDLANAALPKSGGTVTGATTFDAAVTIGSIDAVGAIKAQNEEAEIRRNAAFSVGSPGAIPYGVGPAIPPGMAFFGIGPDAYNPIHLASGSFC